MSNKLGVLTSFVRTFSNTAAILSNATYEGETLTYYQYSATVTLSGADLLSRRYG